MIVLLAVILGIAIGQYVTIAVDPVILQSLSSAWSSVVSRIPRVRDFAAQNSAIAGSSIRKAASSVKQLTKGVDPAIQASLANLKAQYED